MRMRPTADGSAPETASRAVAAAHAVPVADGRDASDRPPPVLQARLEEWMRTRDLRAGEGARFAADELIGVGATGEVYALRDLALGRTVAAKILRGGLAEDAAAVQGFLAEARLTASLQHPNVLPVHDLGRTADGRPFFTMNRIVGGSLGEALQGSTPGVRDPRIATANDVVGIFIALCQAVAYAHHQGIVHQDIKPDNICLGAFGEVLLLDWGCAIRTGDAAGAPRHIYGTPLYMSPEQARAELATPASDIYCLGASLYHVLTTCVPTSVGEPAEFWARKRAGVIDPLAPELRRQVPAALLEIALKALAPAPADRYASAAAMRRDLLDYQAGLAVSALRESLLQRWARWYRFHRTQVRTGIVAAVLVIAFAIAWARERAKETTSWRVVQSLAGREAQPLPAGWSLAKGTWSEPRATAIPITDRGVLERNADGLVLKAASGYADLIADTGWLGDLRVEWDYTALVNDVALNCFLGPDRVSGFTFHVGGWGDPAKAMLTWQDAERELASVALRQRVEVGKTRHFVMEREGRQVRLRIDGEPIFDLAEPSDRASVRGTAFGFDTCSGNQVRIANLEVWHRPLAERISPLAVGDSLAEAGRVAEAASQFRDIANSYPGTALAEEATYRQAICALRSGETAAGGAALVAFEDAAPRSPLVPFAIHERMLQAWQAGNDAAALALLGRLCRFTGHPLLHLACSELADRRRREVLFERQARFIGDPAYPPDMAERVVAVRDELRAWAGRCGQSQLPESFTRAAAKLLRALDRNDLIIEVCASSAVPVAQALTDSGRFAEVLERYGYLREQCGEALSAMGRDEQLLAGAYGDDWILYAAADRGRFDEVLPRFPGNPVAGWKLIAAGRPAEALLHADGMPAITERALIDLRRFAEVEARGGSTTKPGWQLIAQGRYDEVLTAHPGDTWLLTQVALHWLRLGETAKGRDLLARLATQFYDYSGMTMHLAGNLAPALLARAEGRDQDAERLLAGVLARRRDTGARRLWHIAALVAGRIDEAAFRAQPYQRQIETRLLLARGLAHDWAHRAQAACECYRAVLALPWWRLDLDDEDKALVTWRLGSLEAPPHP